MFKMNRNLKNFVRNLLRKYGYDVYRLTEIEKKLYKQAGEPATPKGQEFTLPMQRLEELRQRYSKVSLPVVNHSVWSSRGQSKQEASIGWTSVDMNNFRANNSYVFSYLGDNPVISRLVYYIFADSVRQRKQADLLKGLTEDGAFGCETQEYPGLGRVSRDLLDSIIELDFLERHLGLLGRDDLRLLDIGAGYGRMAHRALEANPSLPLITCVDAIAESTFLCEQYLSYRGLADRAKVVPVDELEECFSNEGSFDLAMNIYSFAECTYSAVEWWLRSLAKMRVPYLFIVPNEPEQFLTTEVDRSRLDYEPLIAELGYRLKVKEPVFDDIALQELMNVHQNMYLFELVE